MFSKESPFFKTWVFESKHQTQRRRTKEFPTNWLCTKKKRVKRKKRGDKKGDQKRAAKKRDININFYIYLLFETFRMIVFGEKKKR